MRRLRLLPAHRFARLSEPLYTVRVHAASSSAVGRADQIARVIEAKLRYLRRQMPDLPWPVRLVLPCDDRGAEVFRRVGPALGYVPTPDECAGTVVFLASDLSRPITGQGICVNAGHFAA